MLSQTVSVWDQVDTQGSPHNADIKAGMLFWCQPDPGCHVPTIFELRCITHRSNQFCSANRANTANSL